MPEEYSGDPVRRLGLIVTILLILGFLITAFVLYMGGVSSGFWGGGAAGG